MLNYLLNLYQETPSDAALFLKSRKRTDGREYVSSPQVMKYKLVNNNSVL